MFAFERRSSNGERIIVVSNFTPVPRHDYSIGVNIAGEYEEILNTDSMYYQGSNVGNFGCVASENIESHGREKFDFSVHSSVSNGLFEIEISRVIRGYKYPTVRHRRSLWGTK